jgi:uncharacterized protein (TIGR03435 family)
MQKIAAIAIGWIVVAMPAVGQGNSVAGAQGAVTQTAQTYEIVSIRPNNSMRPGGTASLPDGFEWRSVSLYLLVQAAYGIVMESQVSGLPSWARSDSYDIVAKADPGTTERWKKLTPRERWAEEQPMMRSILADRCQFKAHLETKELPVYDLVIAKGGLKMKEAQPGEASKEEMTAGRMTVQAVPVELIADTFMNTLGRVIVDKTGLGDRKFDFDLNWTPDDQAAVDDSIDAAPSLLTALQEQLGLKIVSSKGPVQVLIIDHMERPSPN